MASSSVSQDDVDTNFEKNNRRSRIRTARARQINPSACRVENQVVGDTDDGTISVEEVPRHISANTSGEANFGNIEHETSPKPVLRAGAGKDSKRPNKSHHVNKGKQQRDRRKLREKRRSTGVVHLASTESTGGSTTGDDEESSDATNAMCAMALTAETKKNTLENESMSALEMAKQQLLMSSAGFRLENSSSDLSNGSFFGDSHSMTSTCCRCSHRRNKSPSDLEADDENDHDSLKQTGGASCYSRYTSELAHDQVLRVVEENRRLQTMLEERDRRIHMLEFKVQQLMRDTLTISEEQSRLQKENTTLLRALSKLTSERNVQRKSKAEET